jgi:hypothetical protein
MNNSQLLKCEKCKNYCGYKDELLPVSHFGNSLAPVVMLSLNPSYREYDTNKKNISPLFGLEHFGLNSREDLNKVQIDQIIRRQDNYFKNYFLDWFEPAENFLNSIKTEKWGPLSFGINQETSTVTNIDIVKCPTNPTWSKLSHFQALYIVNCMEHLFNQLFSETTQIIYVNGGGAYTALKFISSYSKTFIFSKEKEKTDEIRLKTKDSSKKTSEKCTVYSGELIRPLRKIPFIGLSRRISSDDRGFFSSLAKGEEEMLHQFVTFFINEKTSNS